MTHDWNISQVTQYDNDQNLSTIKVKGFNPRFKYQCVISTITRTTLANALHYNHNYNDGYNISVLNPNEVYIIDTTMYDNINEYTDMSKQNYASIYDEKYFNEDYYMGLPMIVFSQWRGSLITE